MTKVLVTGGAGFIGSHLVDKLIDSGYEVTVIDNLSTGDKANLNPKAEFIYGDIASERLWQDLPKVDIVFHVAALARIQPSIKDPIKPHRSNVDGTLNVLEYCKKHGAKLIYSSSSSVYDGKELPCKENSRIEPKNPYSLQKYICEEYIKLYGLLYGVGYVILRYFNVYGERQLLEGAYTTVLGVFLKQRADGLPLTITGDGDQRRDFTYVGDVVDANILAIGWKGIYNIGRGRNYSVNEIAEAVGGLKQYIDPRPGENRETLADNSKALEAGWQPKVDIKGWIRANS